MCGGNETTRCWEYPFVLDFLLTNKRHKEGNIVLDVGCGNSFFPIEIVKNGFKVYGIDKCEFNSSNYLNDVGIDLELGKKNKVDITYRIQDAQNLPFEDCFFDFVINISVLEHIPEFPIREKIIKEMCRVLKYGGLLMITEDYILDIEDIDFSKHIYVALSAGCNLYKEMVIPNRNQINADPDLFFIKNIDGNRISSIGYVLKKRII